MRTLSAGLFMSLDGVVEAPKPWQFDSFDVELGRQMGAMMGAYGYRHSGLLSYRLRSA
jgi:hypothetical protein